jgi:hypothetical protein
MTKGKINPRTLRNNRKECGTPTATPSKTSNNRTRTSRVRHPPVVGAKNVDLAPDGGRIVAFMPVETAEVQRAQNQVTFLLSFSDELRRGVPISK